MVRDEDLLDAVGATLGPRAHMATAHGFLETQRLMREEAFDLVILDRPAPDGNSVSLAKRIADHLGRTIPIVLLADEIAERPDLDVTAVMVKSNLTASQAATVILSYLPPDAS